MKFSTEIEIDKPIEKVIDLFDNPENMDKWMEGLQSFEPLSGIPGQPDAKARLKVKMGKREIEMIETIITRNLPDEFTGTYEAEGVINIVTNRFIKLSDTKTRYITEQEFQFQGFMRLIACLAPGTFRKQSFKYLADFKKFVENQA